MPETPDLDSFSIEDLDAMMRGEKPIPEDSTPPAEPPATEPTPAAPAEGAPTSQESPAETAPVETAEDDEKEILRAQVEEARALARKQEMQAKRHESLAGKNAGELGFLRDRVRALEQALAQRTGEEIPAYEAERPAATPEPPRREAQDENAEYLRSLALERAGQRFNSQYSDIGEVHEQMAAYLKENMPRYDAAASLIQVEREVTRALEEAYWDAKAAKHRANAEMRQKRQAEQFGRQKEAKMQASISGSSAAPPTSVKEEKTLEQMSVQELEAELVRLTRK